MGDSHCKAVLGDSPDLPAGLPLALPLALPAPPGQPAPAGEVLSAGLCTRGVYGAPAPAASSLPSASVETRADIATQKGCGWHRRAVPH